MHILRVSLPPPDLAPSIAAVMGALSTLVPLIILSIVLTVVAFIGYAVYTVANDVADKTTKKMERKNVVFTKDGMKVGVKEVRNEQYVDQTQRFVFYASTSFTMDELGRDGLLYKRRRRMGNENSSNSTSVCCKTLQGDEG